MKSETRNSMWFDQPFDRPFDRLSVLSKVDPSTELRVDAEQSRSIEGLTTLSKVEGQLANFKNQMTETES